MRRKNGTGCISSGYVRHFINGKWVLEHRIVMESILKRELKPSEIVHHINGNALDNRPENLVVTNRIKHNKQHYINDKHKQYLWSKIRPLGSNANIKKQDPRPEASYEGQRWNNHKLRKCFIVRKCKVCHKLVWQRLDNRNPKGFCIICSGRNANRIRYK